MHTTAVLRNRIAELGLALPIDEQILSASAGSPLAAPINVGGFNVANRWCIHAMEGWDANPDGSPTEHTLRRWRYFGLSGAKLIWGGEAAAVRPDGRANPNQTMAIASNRAGLQALLDTLQTAHHEAFGTLDGLLVGLQLTHSGQAEQRTELCTTMDAATDNSCTGRDAGEVRKVVTRSRGYNSGTITECDLKRGANSKMRAASIRFNVKLLLVVLAVGAAPGDSLAAKPDAAPVAAATPAEQIHIPRGFQVELLYSIPKDKEGSWVNVCIDAKGRLITSDQYGGLYRVTPPPIGSSGKPHIEPMLAEIGRAQGLLWAFDSLYVVVNSEDRSKNGLYRVRDSDGDDVLDSVELLRLIDGDGEHGPHAVLAAPDGKSLYVVCGNATNSMEVTSSRVPPIWDEDQLLPRIYGVGFMRGVPAPGGAIYKVDAEGKEWERVASGFRNPFDIAVNADGELFTFDSDMEWDLGAPWYRPARVCHAVSGSDWGWRNGSAKFPEYFVDTLPPVKNIGLGSPTGIAFGNGAKFPVKYQQALFLCDWTYGKMYALHLDPEGASYVGTAEEFISATPLPFTDVVVNPHDGAMYFLIGGRKTQSGLYRVTYTGSESTAPTPANTEHDEGRALRLELESLHVETHPEAVQRAWPHLDHPDRFIRFAARTALEQQPLQNWQTKALNESRPQAALTAILALVRKVPRTFRPTGPDLDTPPPTYPATEADQHPLEPEVFAALGKLEWQSLSAVQKLEFLRVYELALYRLGPPDELHRNQLISRLESFGPAADRPLNVLLTELLCYLQAPSAAQHGMRLLKSAQTQEDQIDIVRSLRVLKTGWTRELYQQLFEWFVRAQSYHGGNNFATFIDELKSECIANMPASDRTALADLIDTKRGLGHTGTAPARPQVKVWSMDELAPLMATKLKGRDFEQGRAMFAAANCFACHHFAGEGGAVGPDLTGLAGRFSPTDVLESILDPDKEISDQYAASAILTTNGKSIVGRITNFSGDDIYVNTDMMDPVAFEVVKRDDIEIMERSTTSMMPSGLLNTLDEEELLNLMAFLLSRGNRTDAMFSEPPTVSQPLK